LEASYYLFLIYFPFCVDWKIVIKFQKTLFILMGQAHKPDPRHLFSREPMPAHPTRWSLSHPGLPVRPLRFSNPPRQPALLHRHAAMNPASPRPRAPPHMPTIGHCHHLVVHAF
jgi:hypothetical protein